MAALHPDADMAAQLERTLIGAYVGAADLGEALAVASRVEAGDYDAWHRDWSRAGEAAGIEADKALKAGRIGSARHHLDGGLGHRRRVTLFSVPGPWCRPA